LPSAGPTRRQWTVLVLVFLFSLPAVTARIYSSDEIQYFAYLRSLWFDHDLSFDNEYRYFYDHGIAHAEGFHETFLELATETGRRINFGTIGCAILWAPFYAIGDAAAHLTGAPIDGFSKPFIAGVAYGSAVYGWLALVLGLLCARELELNGFWAGLAVWCGTPLLFYMYVAPPFSHACSAFAVALFTYVWLRVRGAWSMRGLVALGAAGALMAMVREQDLFFVAGPALDRAWTAVKHAEWRRPDRGRAIAAIVAGCAAFAVVFTPQVVSYLALNGHVGPSRLVLRKMYWTAPHALQVLFSPRHGFVWWTPLAIFGIAGLVWASVAHRDLAGGADSQPPASVVEQNRQAAVCLLLMVALQLYIGGAVDSWTVAGAYGQRRFVALTTALIIGLAWLFARVRAGMPRTVLASIVALAVYWNVALTAEFGTGLMSHQNLAPAQNAYDAFVTLPREAPSLVYRYLFERSSFYKRGAQTGQ
jgi:hypothetical protein